MNCDLLSKEKKNLMEKNNKIPQDYLVKRQSEMHNLTQYLNKHIKDNPGVDWHYTKFGKQVEQPVIDFLVEKGLLIKEKFKDQSENKNEIPDIIDEQYLQPIFIDIKSGNIVKFDDNSKVSNPNQDLSTTTSWRDKIISMFGGELCYFIEVKYNHFSGDDLFVKECSIDHFYNFVGKTQDGLISHRNRDVRSKPWSSESKFRDSTEFENLLDKTISFAIKKNLLNHSQDLTKDDKIEIIRHLQDK